MKIPQVIETLRKTTRNGVVCTKQAMIDHGERLTKAHAKLRTVDGLVAQALAALSEAVLAKDDRQIAAARTALDRTFEARDTAKKTVEDLAVNLDGLKDLGDLGNAVILLAPAVVWVAENVGLLPPEVQQRFFVASGKIGQAE